MPAKLFILCIFVKVMMELGMELLLKEPVIKKEDRQMLSEGGREAVKFYLELLKKIEAAEEEFHNNREEHTLDFPKEFFL